MRNAFKALLLTAATGAMALSVPGCSAEADDGGDSSENGVSINVQGMKVALAGKDDDSGFTLCDEKIGDYTLTADERKACTLTAFREPLKDRINFLFGKAGREGFFLRTGLADSGIKLERIRVDQAVNKPRLSKFTLLTGSFTSSDDPKASGAKGGVSVYSINQPVTIFFDFVDKTTGEARQETFQLLNAYELIPFFYMKSEMAVNLNVGSILSKFAGGSLPVAGALLSVLGGSSSAHFEAQHEVKWFNPICADSYTDATSAKVDNKEKGERAFDNDFYQNVMKPVCMTFKKDNNANVDCWESRSFDFATLVEKNLPMTDQKVFPLTSCKVMEKPVIGDNSYDVTFIAPKAWGFDGKQKGNLYIRNDNDDLIWERDNELDVMSVDQDKCGIANPKADEVCVHVELKKAFFNGFLFSSDHCGQINDANSKRIYGLSQLDDDKLSYRLP